MAVTAGNAGKVYGISPVRRSLLLATWLVASLALVLPFVFLWLEKGALGVLEIAVFLGALSAMLLVVLLVQVHTTRLVVGPHGVAVRQFGTTVETTWDNVEAIRLTPGAQGLILKRPMETAGAVKLARFGNIALRGVPLHDAEKRRLLAEHRFVPLELFAFWLKHGDLWSELASRAPWLADAQGQPVPHVSAARNPAALNAAGLTVAILLAVMFTLFAFVLPPREQEWLWRGIYLVAAAGVLVAVASNAQSVLTHLKHRHVVEGLFWLFIGLMQLLLGLVMLALAFGPHPGGS